MESLNRDAPYLDVVRDVYAEAAVTPQPKLCCTTAPIWRLPGLKVPTVMQEMNYGCGTTVHPADIGPDDIIFGPEDVFDDGKGHILSRDLPLAVCDKTAAALLRLERPDLLVTGSTFHDRGGGCC